jgi:hypothetical protein
MNIYGKIDEWDNVVYIHIIEGIYYTNLTPKARDLGVINMTMNTFQKGVKQPYTVIDLCSNRITLKRRRFDMVSNTVFMDDTYTLLSELLLTRGYLQENIDKIHTDINAISHNRNIECGYVRILI